MPVQTGELREFAIKNNLFVLNLNKELGDAGAGQNISLLEEVLALAGTQCSGIRLGARSK